MFATIGYILPEYWRRDRRWLFKWVLEDRRCFHEAQPSLKPPEQVSKRFPGYWSKFLDITFADFAKARLRLAWPGLGELAWAGGLGWAGPTPRLGLGCGLGWAGSCYQSQTERLRDRETAARRPQTGQKRCCFGAENGPSESNKREAFREPWHGPHQWAGLGLGLARLAGLGWADLGAGLGLLDWAGLGWANPSRQGNTAARRPQTSQKRTKNDAVAGPKTARLNPAKEKLLAELWQGPHQWAALGLGLAGLARLGWTGLG